ncbi:hypothetical protein FALCPG4_008960 [Fusarium falciforme]
MDLKISARSISRPQLQPCRFSRRLEFEHTAESLAWLTSFLLSHFTHGSGANSTGLPLMSDPSIHQVDACQLAASPSITSHSSRIPHNRISNSEALPPSQGGKSFAIETA